jgi:hypothetical protein
MRASATLTCQSDGAEVPAAGSGGEQHAPRSAAVELEVEGNGQDGIAIVDRLMDEFVEDAERNLPRGLTAGDGRRPQRFEIDAKNAGAPERGGVGRHERARHVGDDATQLVERGRPHLHMSQGLDAPPEEIALGRMAPADEAAEPRGHDPSRTDYNGRPQSGIDRSRQQRLQQVDETAQRFGADGIAGKTCHNHPPSTRRRAHPVRFGERDGKRRRKDRQLSLG